MEIFKLEVLFGHIRPCRLKVTGKMDVLVDRLATALRCVGGPACGGHSQRSAIAA